MNTTQLNDNLDTYLQQLYQWKRLLTVVPVDPGELESILLALHNSLDVINAYNPADFSQQHFPTLEQIDKTLTKIAALNSLLEQDVGATQAKPLTAKFSLYQQFECKT